MHKYCPNSKWIFQNGSCYLIHDEPLLTWSDSRKMCQSLGGDLVLPRSRVENDFVYRKLLPGYNGNYSTNAWIRCFFKDDKWDCSTDPSDFTDWTTSQIKIGNCAIIRVTENGKWRGLPCSDMKRSMCQAPAGLQARTFTCSAISPDDQPRCLTNHSVAQVSIRSTSRCCLACSKDPRCRSFNRKGDTCQLNSVTASEVNDEYFKIVPGCVYYEL